MCIRKLAHARINTHNTHIHTHKHTTQHNTHRHIHTHTHKEGPALLDFSDIELTRFGQDGFVLRRL